MKSKDSKDAWSRYLFLVFEFQASYKYMNPSSADFQDYLHETEQAHIDWLELKLKEEQYADAKSNTDQAG